MITIGKYSHKNIKNAKMQLSFGKTSPRNKILRIFMIPSFVEPKYSTDRIIIYLAWFLILQYDFHKIWIELSTLKKVKSKN